ncbi:helix-turn-helix domain-containing protein [Frigidibacter sp. RF13]|uniref:helix-turn-helix domain-containing protein n=1 Tax=Frigidibacter sp. RF13 TaxID=2997340 RepID=UPI00226EDC3C|nr:helix-turn-helix domain-containing protein [Frigidibacter sp. RF13]MCY1125397.1 helix-turn-helix domain-containing protein [Frigidibacter sp. RF13]
MSDFPSLLRLWRTKRRYSQLALAADAGISARHLSFLETGRARPSRAMVLRLAEVLQMPRGDTNGALAAAGFSDAFSQHRLDSAALAPARAALDRLMQRHMPYPAVMMDRDWRIVDLNPAAARLYGPAGLGAGDSILDVLGLPGGPQAMIENWPEVGAHLLTRLRAESRAGGGIALLDRAAARLAADPDVARQSGTGQTPPLIPTIYRLGERRLSLFSTFVQIGGGEDITLTELRLEMIFPMDEATGLFLETLA